MQRALRSQFDRVRCQLSQRSAEGAVRRCHGDLHLGNIVLLDGAPVPFDALEFDERLGTCDVLYDLAFLLMDLEFRGLRAAANRVFNAYFAPTAAAGDEAALAALPLFLGVRASIRAMVDVQAALRVACPGRLHADARRYLAVATAALAPAPAVLVAVGGLSGSGKTSVARALAPQLGPAPGALHLRSDLERKALFDVDPTAPLTDADYTPAVGRQVAERLLTRATAALRAGHSVLIDATHLNAGDRAAVEDLGRQAGVPFFGFWLDAPVETLLARVAARRGDASDADADVVLGQVKRGAAATDWRHLEAMRPPEATAAAALACIHPLSTHETPEEGPTE